MLRRVEEKPKQVARLEMLLKVIFKKNEINANQEMRFAMIVC